VSVPFVLPMARLYERFVAAWLQRHLDSAWQLNAQERYLLDDQGHFSFTIDLVVRERATGEVRWVLDTKYRAPGHRPSADEIAQILAYAQATGAPEAVLIFPGEVEHPLDLRVGGVWVRSLTFALDGDLEEAGKAFVAALQGRDGFPARA
jgi:5-methylcytosine-specific restriction enzyme subunit McrC